MPTPTTNKKFNFKIGADPEFILTMQGRKVDAKQTIELMLSNKKEFKLKPGAMGFEIKPFGNIGWDGASSTAEIRPNAAHDPQEIVNNIAGILKNTTKYIKVCDMSTLSEFSSVGGHIHLEIPKGEQWTKEKKNLIHKKLASFYLPILISENKTNLNLRLKQCYGSLKDYRIEPHFAYPDGTAGYTFEFRTPSAEWLTTPKIAKATLAYIGTVYHEILNHPKSFTKFNDLIYKNDKQGDALQTLAIMEFNLLTQTILNKAKKYIKTFEMYPYFKDDIDYLFNPKKVIKDKQKTRYNIIVGWSLINQQINYPKKSDILSSKNKIKNIAKKTDFDVLKQVMNIHYNDDTNVTLFAETFKDRVAAFNWKLKNNYFIFGIRKGIPNIIAKNLKNEYLVGDEVFTTLLDRDHTDILFDKMKQKFGISNSNNLSTTLDFITGKPKDVREQTIIIGIPYEMRIQENIKPFLNLIWSLEKNETINRKETPPLIDDYNLPLAQRGEIYKILTKQQEAPENIILDQGSNSLRTHQNVVNEMIREQNYQNNQI